MTSAYNHKEMIPRVFEETARAVAHERPVAELARVKEEVERGRVTVEMVSEPSTQTRNVPVAVPFRGVNGGDVLPVSPGTIGVVLFLDHAVDGLFEGEVSPGMDIEDAIFLPATVAEDEPTIDPNKRVIDHPSGSRIDWDGDGRVRLRHANGSVVEAGGPPEEDIEYLHDDRPAERDVRDPDYMTESEKRAYFGRADNRTYPVGNPGETYSRLDHPDGSAVTVTDRGVSVGDHDDGPREIYSGKPTAGNRVELDGHHQHFHLVDHGDDEYSLAGPPLEFREFIAWMTDSTRQSQLRNSERYAAAKGYAENYLAWLEDELGRSVDPTDPHDWPDPEPMPTASEREEFDPTGYSNNYGVSYGG